jgi:hypothetical protein
MDAHELLDPQELVRLALGELKSAATDVTADRRAAIEEKVKRAEEMLALARSKSAKELGFRIHDCKFPAPLMLWDEGRQAHVCENCGHIQRSAQPKRISHRSSYMRKDGWMAR